MTRYRNSGRVLIAVANPSPSQMTFVSRSRIPSRTMRATSSRVSATRLWPSIRYDMERWDAMGLRWTRPFIARATPAHDDSHPATLLPDQ